MPAPIAPELFVRRAAATVEFYAEAFGAVVDHRVGDGDDIVAQLSVGRLRDPFGHNWEIGKPLIHWPPRHGPGATQRLP